MQTENPEIKAATSPDTAAYFALAHSKVVSLSPNEPFEGWITLAFTDEDDPMGLNNQMFYVPEPLFYKTVERWLRGQGLEITESKD